MSRKLERDGQRDLGATLRAIRGTRASSVRAGDCLHDREPKTDPATSRTRCVRSTEALERVREELGREAVTLVADGEHEHAVRGARLESYCSFAVAEGVVDEVSECLLQPQAVSGDDLLLRRGYIERPSRRARTRVVSARDRVEQPAHVVPLDPQEKPAVIGAREHEEILSESNKPLDLLAGRVKRSFELLG